MTTPEQRALSLCPSFWPLALASLSGYLLISFWFPLKSYFDHLPLLDVRSFSPSLLAGAGYALLLGILFGLYGLAYRRVHRRPARLGVILLTTVLLALPLLQTYPINANDIYRYIIRGRVSSVYGQNPFVVPPDAIPHDPFLPLAGEWASETSPYGPLWELTAAGVTALTGDNLYLGLLLFKTLGLLSHLGISTLIWHWLPAANAGRRAAYTLLWAWNPALLLTFVANAHNDGLMLFWLLLGAWLLQRQKRPAAGLWLMTLAPLFKPIALLPLPFFFLATWRTGADYKVRLRLTLLPLAGGLVAFWLAFWPFDGPLALAARLVREAASGGGFSPLALVILMNQALGNYLSVDAMVNATRAAAGILALWLLWRGWHGRFPERSAADILGIYILQALNFRLWYATWLFPWALLDGAEQEAGNGRLPYRARVAIWFLLTTQLSVLIYGHLRVYALGGSHLAAHLIGVPFTFGLPWLLAAYHRRATSAA